MADRRQDCLNSKQATGICDVPVACFIKRRCAHFHGRWGASLVCTATRPAVESKFGMFGHTPQRPAGGGAKNVRSGCTVPQRRSTHALLADVENARSDSEKAQAHFKLALFHDNNGREAVAIPHYREALRLGLDRKSEAEALAWLASSLYKTSEPREAMVRANESLSLTEDSE